MKKVLMLLVAVGVVCAVGSAEAEKAKKTGEKKVRLFADFDINADGKIDKEEYVVAKQEKGKTAQTARFIKLDTDKDGFLTETEYAAGSKSAAKGKKKAN
jgi:Ca2+-binding EF-hand superfamily protein